MVNSRPDGAYTFLWWARTVETWQYEILLQQFIDSCWDSQLAAIAASVSQRRTTLLCTGPVLPDVFLAAA